jgi:PII-like signaling protein
LRGIEGFGPEHHLSTERLPEIAENLPVVIEIVERVEQIERFLPLLDEMVPQGMITVSDVRIVRKGGAR